MLDINKSLAEITKMEVELKAVKPRLAGLERTIDALRKLEIELKAVMPRLAGLERTVEALRKQDNFLLNLNRSVNDVFKIEDDIKGVKPRVSALERAVEGLRKPSSNDAVLANLVKRTADLEIKAADFQKNLATKKDAKTEQQLALKQQLEAIAEVRRENKAMEANIVRENLQNLDRRFHALDAQLHVLDARMKALEHRP